jgi:hypothetical protein
MKKTEDTYLYTAARHKYGWLINPCSPDRVRPSLPMPSFIEVTKLPGLTEDSVIHPGIAHALNAILALGTKEGVNLWAGEIDAALEQEYGADVGEAWLRGTLVGNSSKTIYHALEKRKFLDVAGDIHGLTLGECTIRPSVPHDASDFERCLHLVNLMQWRSRLHEVATTYPIWAKLVKHWDELAALSAPMTWKQLTQRIKELTT